ncbi:MAG: Flagellar biosynthesis protein FlhF [Planctomycetota bacterium]|jgi:flagellar biosynthesis GTPase FlhF
MNRVRYVADSMAEAMSAARRNHGMDVRVLRAGARRSGTLGLGMAFEVVVDAGAGAASARRAAREALARAVLAAHRASREATATLEGLAEPGLTAGAGAAARLRLTARLRAQGLPDDLAAHVLREVDAELLRIDRRASVEELDGMMRAAALRAVAALLPVAPPCEPARALALGRPLVLAVAGPTGVGKTTTLAKLAGAWRLGRGLRVGIIAADAFRVGAVEQLRTYGGILGVPVHAADGPSSAAEALARLADRDVVLVDTPGRGHRDAARIAEVAAVVRAVRADETVLALAGSGAASTLARAVDAFAVVRPTRVALTKLDESESLGGVLAAARGTGCGAAWFATGQEVPDDLEAAHGERFAARLLGEGHA